MHGLVGLIVLILLTGFTVYLFNRRTDRIMEMREQYYTGILRDLKSEIQSLYLELNRIKSKLHERQKKSR